MVAIPKAVTFLDVIPSPTTPVARFAIVLAPSIYGMVTNGNLSLVSSLALEVRGLVHVVVNAAIDTGDGIGSHKAFRAVVHCKVFGLEGFFEGTNMIGDLGGL